MGHTERQHCVGLYSISAINSSSESILVLLKLSTYSGDYVGFDAVQDYIQCHVYGQTSDAA